MLEGKAVLDFFAAHPEAKKIVENSEFQFQCWQPKFKFDKSKYIRKITLEDIKYITFKGFFEEKGIFAWFYPCGTPHYMKIAECI